MEKDKPFSLRRRGRSFKYAFAGIKDFFRSEHNAWIHLVATLAAIVLAVIAHISRVEVIALTFAIGFVWIAELFNTAIEKIMDFISAEQNPRIGFIKDLSAGTVLIAAVVAVITGCIIFIPKL